MGGYFTSARLSRGFRQQIGAQPYGTQRRSRAVYSGLVLLAANWQALRALAAERPPDLATLRAAVDSYAPSIKTLQGKLTVKTSRAPGSSGGEGIPLEDRSAEYVFAAELPEGRWFLDTRVSYYLPARNGRVHFLTHETNASDGRQSYALSYSRGIDPVATELQSDLPMTLTIGTGTGRPFQSDFAPWDLTGQRMSPNLPNLLRDSYASVEGWEEANGAECVRVAQVVGGQRPLTVWLDPEHDYLPRRINAGFDIFEFRRFSLGTGAGERWFPVRGRLGGRIEGIKEFTITELEINAAIDPSRFTIDPQDLPEGVKVRTNTGMNATESYTGDRRDLWEERSALAAKDDRRVRVTLASAPLPKPAEPPSTLQLVSQALAGIHWSFWLVAGVGVVFIAGAAVNRFRTRGSPERPT